MIYGILYACVYIYFRGGWVEFIAFIRFPQEYVIPRRLRSTALEPLSKRFERVLGSHATWSAFSDVIGPGLCHLASKWVLADVSFHTHFLFNPLSTILR